MNWKGKSTEIWANEILMTLTDKKEEKKTRKYLSSKILNLSMEQISNLNAENDLNEILNNYSATKAAEHVKILYGKALNKDRELTSIIPEEFKISPPYPNPFNPTTTISFQLPAAMQVDIHVFNLMGQQIWSSKKKYQPGFHDIRWYAVDKSGQALSSGVYIIKVKAGNNISTQKAILMK